MKTSRIILSGIILISILFTSCKGTGKLSSSDNDDVYLDPKRDRSYFYKADEPRLAVVNTPAKMVDDTIYNPSFKAKDFNYDDYYDNQYASKLKRFHNPMNGVGYYDSYYTNSYFYNNNSYQYGVSIYNGYNFFGSSYNNYMYVPNYNWNGFGSNVGYNSYCNNNGWAAPSYGINNWGNNSYYGNNNYNSLYYVGWGNQFGNNYYNNYGYNNSYDYNSSVYNGPRVSHSGGNSKQVINPGMSVNRKMAPVVSDNSVPKTAMPPTDIKRFDQVVIPKQTNFGSTPTPLKGGSTTPNDIIEPQPKRGGFFNNNTESSPVNNEGNSEPRPKKPAIINSSPTPVIPKTKNESSAPPKQNTGQMEYNGGGKTSSTPYNNNNSGGTIRPAGGGNNGGGVKPRK